MAIISELFEEVAAAYEATIVADEACLATTGTTSTSKQAEAAEATEELIRSSWGAAKRGSSTRLRFPLLFDYSDYWRFLASIDG